MSYRHALVLRWSRRDRLAVVLIAVTVAFLTGTLLLTLAIGAETATVAGHLETPGSASYLAAGGAEPPVPEEAVVVPVAGATVNGTAVTVVGVPPNATLPGGEAITVGGSDVTSGTATHATPVTFEGSQRTVVTTVRPRPPDVSLFVPSWYVGSPALVDRLGTTGRFVLTPDTSPATPGATVPLVGALAFFLAGTTAAVETLTLTAFGAALLVGVTVFSVTRMSVLDRRTAIRVARATGAPPRHILGVFATRAALLTGVGTAFGYAIGLVAVRIAVNIAVTVGVPSSLTVAVTPRAMSTLAPMYLGIWAIGTGAGAIATVPLLRRSPARIGRRSGETGRELLPPALRPRLLGWSAIIPTTATLTAFVVFVVLMVSVGGMLSPGGGAGGEVLMESGRTHPFESHLPETYVPTLQDQGVAASGEIVLLQVIEGQSFLARGAEFADFAAVTDARLTAGRRLRGPSEAVVGADLAATLGLGVGDHLPMGGSTAPAVTRVEIVGEYKASGIADDQLIVSMATARHLRGMGPGQVNIVRADRLPATIGGIPANDSIEETLDAPGNVVSNTTFNVTLRLANAGDDPHSISRLVRFREQTATVELTAAPGTTASRRVAFESGTPGKQTVSAGDLSTTVAVRPADGLWLVGLPDRIPPNSTPRVRVVGAGGNPVGGATVTVGGRRATADADGAVRLPIGGAGETTIRLSAGNRRGMANVSVEETAKRTLDGRILIEPEAPTPLVQPTATVLVANIWNRTLTRTVTIAGPSTAARTVTVAPGETTTVSVRFPRRPSDTYVVTARSGGEVFAKTTYTVSGDDRVFAAIASAGRTESGFGSGIETAFGNLQILAASLLVLAAGMTVGGTTTAFAQSVHARTRTIGVLRATGRPRGRILGTVIRDATIVGVVASAIAVVAGWGLVVGMGAIGHRSLFGLRLATDFSIEVIGGAFLGGVLLAILGATIATVGTQFGPPAGLLRGGRAPRRGLEEEH